MRTRYLGLAAVLLAGCVEPRASTCEDGFVCGADQVCAPTGGGCVDPDQVAACDGKLDGDGCTLPVGDGVCVAGVCMLGGCGNGDVEPGEACDDGNVASGDGCRADCAKVEACGDAVVDAGEACDDGNANEVDGCDACVATAWSAEALLAGAVDALTVRLNAVAVGVTVDGDVLVCDFGARVWRLDRDDGTLTVVAGTGVAGFAGDGGPATAAQITSCAGIAVDGAGNMYVSDAGNHRIRRIDAADGTIHTIAGTGSAGDTGDGGPATTAQLRDPVGVVVDGLGNLFVADAGSARVRRIDGTSGVISAFAGTGISGNTGDGGPATAAQLQGAYGLTRDPAGNVYVATGQHVRRVDAASGVITTVAGGGATLGDGGPATSARLIATRGVAATTNGGLYVLDQIDQRVRYVAADGVVTTAVGTGMPGLGGDGGLASAASVRYPNGIAVSPAGDLFIANATVRRVDVLDGIITTIAGTIDDYDDDGRLATAAGLSFEHSVKVDGAGNVYVTATGTQRVRKIGVDDHLVTTVAGNGTQGFSGDGGPATAAQLFYPRGGAVTPDGVVYVADTANCRIRRIDLAGEISTFAGTGSCTPDGDGGPAIAAGLAPPGSVDLDAAGNLYLMSSATHTVRRIDGATGVITTIAGGLAGFAGDGGLATAASLNGPASVAVNSAGDVFIADANNHRIRRIDHVDGVISTVAGTGGQGYAGDDGPATAALLWTPLGLAVGMDGTLYIADSANRAVRRIDGATQIISTIAGGPTAGTSGDGGPAHDARMTSPRGVALDDLGHLFVADAGVGRIRAIDLVTGTISTVAGALDPAGSGPAAIATLADPQALVIAPELTLVASGGGGVVQALRAGSDALATVIGRYPHELATGDLARYRDATFGDVGGVAFDAAAGVIYLSETSASRLHAVTIVDPADATTWTIAALGDGVAGFADGALATARFAEPRGLWFDAASRVLYVADAGNHVVRAVDVDGQLVTTVAGTPRTLGYFGDGAAATDALLFAPTAVTRASNGDLFIADTGNHRLRRVAAGSGVISTVLGDGVAASSGEGAPADAFPVHAPRGVVVDARGNVYVTSATSVRLLVADADGIVDGTSAVQTIYGAAPRDTFPASATSCLTGVALVDAATVQITDACAGLLVELRRAPVGP